MKKQIFLALFILLAASTGLSLEDDDFSFANSDEDGSYDYTTNYDEDVKIEVDCKASDCPSEVNFVLEECQAVKTVEASGVTQNSASYDTNLNIPKDMACLIGEKTLQVKSNNNERITASLKVNSQGSQPKNKGKYLYAGLNTDESNLHHFFVAGSSGDYTDGRLIVTEYNPKSSPCSLGCTTTNVYSINNPGDVDSEEKLILRDEAETLEQLRKDTLVSSGAASVLFEEFGTQLSDKVGKYRKNFKNKKPSDYTPTHNKDGEYLPENEIIIGYKEYNDIWEEEKDDVDEAKRKFYICRGSMDKTTIDIYKGSSNKRKLYRCDAKETDTSDSWRHENSRETGWISVAKCQDGLDNDQDKKIDAIEDDGCENDPEKNSEKSTGGSKCVPRVTYNKLKDKYTAKWDAQNEFEPCNYEKSQTFDSFKNTISGWEGTFTCEKGSTRTPPDRYAAQKADFCEKVDYSYGLVRNSNPPDGTEMPSVAYKYFTESDLISEAQAEGVDMSTGGSWRSEYVGSRGWKIGLQSLYQAEKKYDGDGSESQCTDCLKKSTWDEKSMSELSNYDDSDPTNDDKAWTWGHVDQGTNEIGSTSIFDGGFGGKCGSGQKWRYAGQDVGWACASTEKGKVLSHNDDPDAGPDLVVEFLQIGGVSRAGGNYVGFRVPWDTLRKWDKAYIDPINTGNKNGNLKIRAQCWEGKPSQRPTGRLDSEVINISKEVSSYGKDYVVAGQIPQNSNSKVKKDKYSCLYGFQQEVNYGQNPPPSNVKLYVNKNGEAKKVYEAGQETQNALNNQDIGFITEGTTVAGNLRKIEADTVTPTTPSGTTIQDWLKDKASGTQTVDNNMGNDPWKHFWKGAPQKSPRHPGAYCEKDGPC